MAIPKKTTMTRFAFRKMMEMTPEDVLVLRVLRFAVVLSFLAAIAWMIYKG